jgi:predicted esterase
MPPALPTAPAAPAATTATTAPLLNRRTLLGWGAGLGAGVVLGGASGCAWRGQGFDDGRGAPPTGSLSSDTGNPRVSQHEMEWVDARRDRAVPVRLYLPTDPAALSRPLPLMVFSHGIGGSRRGYSYLGHAAAENGWASLHLQHIGSDRSLWIGNPFTLVSRLNQAAQDSEAVARAHDLRFALDQLLSDPQFSARIDAQHIIAAGHSYGANTSLLAAGASVTRGGRTLALRDDRLRGLVLLSAPPFYGEAHPETILGPVQLPSLHITTTDDEIVIPGYQSPPSDRVAVYQATGSRNKALAVYKGGPHSVFTDRSTPGGTVLNADIKLATRELLVCFLNCMQQSTLPTVAPLQSSQFAPWESRHASLLAHFELQQRG